MRSHNDHVAVIVPLRVDVCPVLWKHLVYGTVCVALCVCQLWVFVSVCECVCECGCLGKWIAGAGCTLIPANRDMTCVSFYGLY